MNINNFVISHRVPNNTKLILCFYYLIFVVISCTDKTTFPEMNLLINQEEKKINLSNGEYIALVFSTNDCSACIDNIVAFLNEINDEPSKNFEIIGILNTKYRQAINKIRYNYGINFTLLQDSSSTTKKFFSKSSYLIQKPILVHLRNGNVIKKGIVGEQDDQHKIREILTYLK